ncbi:hypothetical protein GCM10012275_01180 [Longimycelium tulufanense]|uniref:Peptidase M20 dimerisation domain-containing protein n=1 Tax=Longimycelium tulufanense TaxID=907463 RepID=A0A8J3FUB4_9PSEU|nr:peptidase dimerization domain-containing protein [Longimycelium tulufanense]GGM33531.1 hypothetical protein GCM10012275_01180 [Longimycelium tulufanense]
MVRAACRHSADCPGSHNVVSGLATLHDDEGHVIVPGLTHDDFPWAPVDTTQFAHDAGVRPGVPLAGTGPLAERRYGRPALNVIGLDGVNTRSGASNVLPPKATARISVRLAPSQEPKQARAALQRHFDSVKPWGIEPRVTFLDGGAGLLATSTSAYHSLARAAMAEAYQANKVEQTGQGGSIPLVHAFHKVNPNADIVLWGCEQPPFSFTPRRWARSGPQLAPSGEVCRAHAP